MSWATPTQPNLNDYCLFVLYSMSVDPLNLPNVPPPPMPVLTAGSAGSLATGTVYVKLTYVSALGETNASPEASVAVTGLTGSVSVASPAVATGATGYNVYVSSTSGAEGLQNGSPVAIGTPLVVTTLAATVSPPATNTAGSPWLGYAFTQAQNLVLTPGRHMWGNFPYPSAGIDYTLAVYNCAGHIQIKITPDQVVDNISRRYFQEQRNEYKLLNLSAGLVMSSSNVDTSSSFAVSDSMKQLTLTDLDVIKTPWGRSALAYMQDYGPTVWAVS
jgi:hypothetical protein